MQLVLLILLPLLQVHDAVAGAAAEVGRRLSERLATKQELTTLSHKVGRL